MLEALVACEPEMLTVRSETPQSDPTLQTINSLSDLYDRELVCIIGWAKQIPGNIRKQQFQIELPTKSLPEWFSR